MKKITWPKKVKWPKEIPKLDTKDIEVPNPFYGKKKEDFN